MVDHVEVPPEDCLSSGLGPISLPEIILRYGAFIVSNHLLVGAENPVDLVEEVPEYLAPLHGSSLDN